MSVSRVIYQWIQNSQDFVDVDMGELFQTKEERNP